MKIYLYIRLSASDTDLKYKSESDSIANQRSLLHQFVDSHSEFNGCEVEEFVDDGFTGTNAARPSFEKMIDSLKDGAAQVVICKDFSRFFRDYTELGDYLERIFPFLGIRFISVNDGYDSDDYKGTTGGMEVVMKYIIYSFYSRDISKKIRASMDVRMKAGEFTYPYAPFGYMKDPNEKHHLIPDPDTSPIVRKIFDLALTGNSVNEIAKTLNDEGYETPSRYFRKKYPENGRFRNTSPQQCWDRSNVRTILGRFEYTGACVFKKKEWKSIDNPRTKIHDRSQWLIVPNCHEALITEEEYNQAQTVVRKTKSTEKTRQEYLLRSLVRCGACGRMMRRNSRRKRPDYKCDSSKNSQNTECPVTEHFYEDEIENVVIGSLRQMLSLLVEHKKMIETAASKSKGSAANLHQSFLRLEKSIKQNKLARENGYERYADGQITRDEYKEMRDRLAAELEHLEEEKARLGKDLAAMEAAEKSELSTLGKQAESFLKAKEITNPMLSYFIKAVYIYSGMRIEIKYRFSDELISILNDETDQSRDRK